MLFSYFIYKIFNFLREKKLLLFWFMWSPRQQNKKDPNLLHQHLKDLLTVWVVEDHIVINRSKIIIRLKI